MTSRLEIRGLGTLKYKATGDGRKLVLWMDDFHQDAAKQIVRMCSRKKHCRWYKFVAEAWIDPDDSTLHLLFAEDISKDPGLVIHQTVQSVVKSIRLIQAKHERQPRHKRPAARNRGFHKKPRVLYTSS